MLTSIRMRRPVVLFSAAALLIISVGLASAANAAKNPNPRWYRPDISPKPLSAGATTLLTFTITNGYNSAHSLGSANINVPAGFTLVGSPSDPITSGDESWTSSLNGAGNVIQLRNPGPNKSQRLNFGESVQVSFNATAPCTAGSYVWTSAVRITNDFSNNGKNFIISPGLTNPRTSVSGVCPVADHLAFDVQPTDTLMNDPITPAVTVDVMDASNNVVASDNSTQVSLTIGANPGSGTLTGGGPVTAVNGVATFSGLSIDNSSSGYTLTAASGGLGSDTSGTFDILSSEKTDCTSGCTATATNPDNPNSTVTVDAGAGGGQLSITYEGVPLDCGDNSTQDIGGTVTINPPSGAPLPITVTFNDTISKPIQDTYPVCKTVEQDNTTTTELVPFCSDISNGLDKYAADHSNTAPCIDSQTVHFHGANPPTLTTVLLITTTDPTARH